MLSNNGLHNQTVQGSSLFGDNSEKSVSFGFMTENLLSYAVDSAERLCNFSHVNKVWHKATQQRRDVLNEIRSILQLAKSSKENVLDSNEGILTFLKKEYVPVAKCSLPFQFELLKEILNTLEKKPQNNSSNEIRISIPTREEKLNPREKALLSHHDKENFQDYLIIFKDLYQNIQTLVPFTLHIVAHDHYGNNRQKALAQHLLKNQNLFKGFLNQTLIKIALQNLSTPNVFLQPASPTQKHAELFSPLYQRRLALAATEYQHHSLRCLKVGTALMVISIISAILIISLAKHTNYFSEAIIADGILLAIGATLSCILAPYLDNKASGYAQMEEEYKNHADAVQEQVSRRTSLEEIKIEDPTNNLEQPLLGEETGQEIEEVRPSP